MQPQPRNPLDARLAAAALCLAGFGSTLPTPAAAAQPAPRPGLLASALDPHTLRTLRVARPSQQQWEFAIEPLSEASGMSFADADGHPIEVGAFRGIRSDFGYGFSLRDGADFDLAYAVTAISRDGDARARGNPKCVFLFTALAPAVPDTQVVNFAGAACRLQRDAAGNLYLLLDKE